MKNSRSKNSVIVEVVSTGIKFKLLCEGSFIFSIFSDWFTPVVGKPILPTKMVPLSTGDVPSRERTGTKWNKKEREIRQLPIDKTL